MSSEALNESPVTSGGGGCHSNHHVLFALQVLNLFTAILLEAFVDKLKPEKEKKVLPNAVSVRRRLLASSDDSTRSKATNEQVI